VLGHREFWSLDFVVTEATLNPRPDSETLVEEVLAARRDRPPARILDLGTGTGCLLLSLLKEWPGAWGMGVDRSEAAARVARLNAVRLGLESRSAVVVGDWADALDGTFDVVVANPPYIPDREIAGLAPEVARFEPRGALSGGPDGLDAYRSIARMLPRLLADGGIVALEVGAGQAPDVARLLAAGGLSDVRTARDLGSVERVVSAKKGLAKPPASH
jgi:release factor glutamine methyltransferase